MTALAVAAVLWPLAALVAYVLRLRHLATEADKERAHDMARVVRFGQESEAEFHAALEKIDARVARLESGRALGR